MEVVKCYWTDMALTMGAVISLPKKKDPLTSLNSFLQPPQDIINLSRMNFLNMLYGLVVKSDM